jgi:Lon protease-like protein
MLMQLPLFPLNTVLFPGMPINLHIFEERYKTMINLCLDTQQPFGVVLIREGREALGPLAEPYPIGCTAQITQVERLEDGRMNILAIGMERFQIRSLSRDKAYLTGMIELYPLQSSDSERLEDAGHELRPWVERYLSVLATAAEELDFDASRLPDDPLSLAYLAAALVQIPAAQKQNLLAVDDAAEFVTAMGTLYRREVSLIHAIMEREKPEESGLFSAN